MPIIDPAVLQARLAAAEAAYHALRIGSLREVVDHNGTRIQYSRADADKLKGYIEELQNDLNATAAPRQVRRAIVSWF